MDKTREELRKLDIEDVLDYILHESKDGIWSDIGDAEDIFDTLVDVLLFTPHDARKMLRETESSTGLYNLEHDEENVSRTSIIGINSVDALLDIVEYQMPIAPEIIVLKQELEKL